MNKKPFDVLNYKSQLGDKNLEPVVEWLTQHGVLDLKAMYDQAYLKVKNKHKKVPEIFEVEFNDFGRFFLFKLFDKTCNEVVPGATRLGGQSLRKLFSHVRVENPSFFPLKDNYLNKMLKGEPNMILAKSVSYPQYNGVSTAGMTYSGDLILSNRFCQNLINFAFLTGSKPTSSKYVCNGGKLPDDLHYIEFVLIHELLHYSCGDFHMSKLLKERDKIINFATDYRSNYKIVKDGHIMLPMGLFSPYLNYDQQKTLRELLDKVKELFNKLEPEDQDQSTDEHFDSQGNNQTNPDNSIDQDGKSKKSGNSGEEEVEEEGKGGEEKDANDSKEGNGKGGKDSKTAEEKAAEAEKKRQEKALRRVTEKDIEENEKRVDQTSVSGEEKPDQNNNNKSETPSLKGGGANRVTLDLTKVKPKYNWEAIIRMAVASATTELEETYARPSRSMGTRLASLKQTGTAVIKPGEKPLDKPKFLFVVDTSGSMATVIETVFANLKTLMKNKNISPDLKILNFSESFEVASIDLKKKRGKVINIETNKPTNLQLPIEHFLVAQNSGTVFSRKLCEYIKKRADEGYTVIACSDYDMLAYVENLSWLYRQIKSKLNFIFDTEATYREIVNQLGYVPIKFTYFN